jgi:hypothetical protein
MDKNLPLEHESINIYSIIALPAERAIAQGGGGCKNTGKKQRKENALRQKAQSRK